MLTALLQFPGIILAALASFTVSCPFAANRLIPSLEEEPCDYRRYAACDVIIVLGGGTVKELPAPSGIR
ncbi:MAG: hypothetical protein ACOC2H_10170 [Spirochaetota bacterium]